MRNNERYLAFSPAVPQAFLVHSGEVRPKIVGHGKVTLKNKKKITFRIQYKSTSLGAIKVRGLLEYHILKCNSLPSNNRLIITNKI